ncbi:MAG: hypothetical protein AAFX92_02505 [Pseudomonadota bacterium]
MSILRDILSELAAMFWADRRLNLGLLAVTVFAIGLGIIVPSVSAGWMPVGLALGYGAVIAWALLYPSDRRKE